MTTLRNEAKKYEPKVTKNISDLKEIFTEVDVQPREFTNKDGEIVKIKVIEVDGVEYRVPDSVLKQLKVMIEEKPEIVKFKVRKSGEGLKTTYMIIPLKDN